MNLANVPYIGELLALAAPLSWAFAVILFRWAGETVPPFTLNLFKNALGLLLGLLTLLAIGQPLFQAAPIGDYLLLIGGGALGIGVADLLFFMALNRVGASLWSIINTGYSPSIILLAILFLGETLAPLQWVGVMLILGAVGSVALMQGKNSDDEPDEPPASPSEPAPDMDAGDRRTQHPSEPAPAPDIHVGDRRKPHRLVPRNIPRAVLLAGVGIGLLALLSQAASVIMVKPLLERTDLIWNYVWRIFGGLLFMLFVWPFMPQRREIARAFRRRGDLLRMLPGSLVGTYVALMFWLGGMKYAKASVASVLNQMSTLFIFVLAVLILREPVTWKRVAGLLVGLSGVALVTFGG